MTPQQVAKAGQKAGWKAAQATRQFITGTLDSVTEEGGVNLQINDYEGLLEDVVVPYSSFDWPQGAQLQLMTPVAGDIQSSIVLGVAPYVQGELTEVSY